MQFRSMPANDAQIQEGRDFSNPIVRFRKIRGRIVPIYNRKRIGQEVRGASGAALKAGAAIGVVGVSSRIVGKYFANRPKINRPKMSSFSYTSKRPMAFPRFLVSPESVFSNIKKPKIVKAISLAAKPLKLIGRNPLKVAAALAGLGVIGKFYGTHLEMTSELGLDVGAE